MVGGEWVNFGATRAGIDAAAGPSRQGNAGWVALLALAGAFAAETLTSDPQVNTVLGQLKAGRKKIMFEQIDTAQLHVELGMTGRVLRLRFGMTAGLQVVVALRAGERLLQTPRQRANVLMMLERSHIVMPTSSYDPTGSFARWNFPSNLTKAQAIDVVTNPPAPRDPLPIPPVS